MLQWPAKLCNTADDATSEGVLMELRQGRRRCYGTLPRRAVLAMELQ